MANIDIRRFLDCHFLSEEWYAEGPMTQVRSYPVTDPADNYDSPGKIYVCINPLFPNKPRKLENISAFRAILIERDDELERAKQLQYIDEQEIPYTTLVWSGSKSVHALVSISGIKDKAEYNRLVRWTHAALPLIDHNVRDASRLSRMPTCKQPLLAANGTRLTLEQYTAWLKTKCEEPVKIKKFLSGANVISPIKQPPSPLDYFLLEKGHWTEEQLAARDITVFYLARRLILLGWSGTEIVEALINPKCNFPFSVSGKDTWTQTHIEAKVEQAFKYVEPMEAGNGTNEEAIKSAARTERQ